MQEAGIDRAGVYVTNAVKHFKFEERGKRRIHKKPSTSQVWACRPWLDAEIESVGPKVIVVCLGDPRFRTGSSGSWIKFRGSAAAQVWVRLTSDRSPCQARIVTHALARTPDR